MAPAVEEGVEAICERGELDREEAVFRLPIDSYGGYAEGHNCLGLIALDRGRLDEAAAQFNQSTIPARSHTCSAAGANPDLQS